MVKIVASMVRIVISMVRIVISMVRIVMSMVSFVSSMASRVRTRIRVSYKLSGFIEATPNLKTMMNIGKVSKHSVHPHHIIPTRSHGEGEGADIATNIKENSRGVYRHCFQDGGHACPLPPPVILQPS